MRIAFIVDQFPTLSETFILNQITGLIDRGHEVDIYCDRPGNTAKLHSEVTEYHLLERTHCIPIPQYKVWRYLQGIVLLLVNSWKAPKTVLKTLNYWKYKRCLYGDLADFLKPLYLTIPFLNQPDYNIIHCHFGRNGLKAILLKDIGVINGKILVTFHGHDLSAYLKLHGDDVYNYLFKRADLFQPISHFQKKKLISLGCNQDKVMVHHMGIDCQKFLSGQQKNHSQKVLIVSIARFVEKKGLSYGIQAVAQLIAKHPQLQLHYHIIGDGILKPKLEQQIEQLKVKQQIRILGWKNQQELQTIMAQADIVLAPSITSSKGNCEGIPVSLMEAMAQEIPVVSTYHSGIPELVDPEVSGYLVPEHAIESLTEKLEQLIISPQLRQQMGRAGRCKVINDYNIELLCDRLNQTYQELIYQ